MIFLLSRRKSSSSGLDLAGRACNFDFWEVGVWIARGGGGVLGWVEVVFLRILVVALEGGLMVLVVWAIGEVIMARERG